MLFLLLSKRTKIKNKYIYLYISMLDVRQLN